MFGRDAADMALAANTVIASGGGVAVVRGGAVVAALELPIAGILSPLPARRGRRRAARGAGRRSRRRAQLRHLVVTQPLFQVMLSSLACLPGPHVTDVGLIDGTTGELVATALIS